MNYSLHHQHFEELLSSKPRIEETVEPLPPGNITDE